MAVAAVTLIAANAVRKSVRARGSEVPWALNELMRRSRNGTNTDLLRGLIRVLVDHPDGFESGDTGAWSSAVP